MYGYFLLNSFSLRSLSLLVTVNCLVVQLKVTESTKFSCWQVYTNGSRNDLRIQVLITGER